MRLARGNARYGEAGRPGFYAIVNRSAYNRACGDTLALSSPTRARCTVFRGNVDRGPIFFGKTGYKVFPDVLAALATSVPVSVHSHALMTNHGHLLVTSATDRGLGLAHEVLRATLSSAH